MKKLIVIALAVIMALSLVLVLAACGGETVEGEYSYVSAYNEAQKYGCKVKVTVKGGVITAISVEKDSENFFNLSSGWEDKAIWEKDGQAMIDSFVGRTVEEINAIKVATQAETKWVGTDENDATKGYYASVKGQPEAKGITGAPAELKVVAGATQSSGRLILAVQDALSKLAK